MSRTVAKNGIFFSANNYARTLLKGPFLWGEVLGGRKGGVRLGVLLLSLTV